MGFTKQEFDVENEELVDIDEESGEDEEDEFDAMDFEEVLEEE